MKKTSKERVFAYMSTHPEATAAKCADALKINPNTVAGYVGDYRKQGSETIADSAVTEGVKAPMIRFITTATEATIVVQPSMSATQDLVLFSIREKDAESAEVYVVKREEAVAFANALLAVAGAV